MTMVTTRSETQPLGSPEPPPDREPPGTDLLPPEGPLGEGSGHPDAPRADLWGVRTWRPTARLLWSLALVLLLSAAAVTATLGRSAWQQQRDAVNRAEALAAGRQIAVNFVTMSAASFD